MKKSAVARAPGEPLVTSAVVTMITRQPYYVHRTVEAGWRDIGHSLEHGSSNQPLWIRLSVLFCSHSPHTHNSEPVCAEEGVKLKPPGASQLSSLLRPDLNTSSAKVSLGVGLLGQLVSLVKGCFFFNSFHWLQEICSV